MKVIFIHELGKGKIRRRFFPLGPAVMYNHAGIAHSRVVINIDEAKNITDPDKKKEDRNKDF